MRILYLYDEVMGYTMATISELNERYGAEIHIIHRDTKKLTPYQPRRIKNVYFYGRSKYQKNSLLELACKVNPDLVIVSGWQDRGYLQVARFLRKKKIIVITGSDNQWHGTLRQYIISFLCCILKRYFSHIWICGPYQYEYARRLGFKKNEIVFNLYSADLPIFNDAFNKGRQVKRNNYPHRFLFVGRFEKVKAIDLLVKSWNRIEAKRKDWELHCIGNGSLKSFLKSRTGITVKDFMQPETLKREIAGAGCFILPSRKEAWGVVVHEFSAAGLPIICSDACGAAPIFLIHGLNGFKFQSGNTESLSKEMLNIINSDDQTLFKMSELSHQLGQHITPDLSAASLMSLLN